MKNHIIGLTILACTVLILFTGTASVLGTVSIGAGPELIDIVTNAPSGENYSAATILAEIALDLNPIYWIPDFTAAVMFPDAPHYSTFSKIPRFLYKLQGLNTSLMYRVSIYNSSDCDIVLYRPPDLQRDFVHPGESFTFYTDSETEWNFFVNPSTYEGGYYYLKKSDNSDYLYVPEYDANPYRMTHTRTRFFYDVTFYVIKVDDPIS